MSAAALQERIARMAKVDKAEGVLGPWSTGEQLAVCLVLDRHDWLQECGYTMLQATERLGEEWLRAAYAVQRRGI